MQLKVRDSAEHCGRCGAYCGRDVDCSKQCAVLLASAWRVCEVRCGAVRRQQYGQNKTHGKHQQLQSINEYQLLRYMLCHIISKPDMISSVCDRGKSRSISGERDENLAVAAQGQPRKLRLVSRTRLHDIRQDFSERAAFQSQRPNYCFCKIIMRFIWKIFSHQL